MEGLTRKKKSHGMEGMEEKPFRDGRLKKTEQHAGANWATLRAPEVLEYLSKVVILREV